MKDDYTKSVSDVARRNLQRQRELEDRSIARGAFRFDRRLEKAQDKGRGSTHGAAKKLLAEGWPRLEAAIENWLQDQTTGRGRRHTLVPYVQDLGCDRAAAIALKLCLDRLHKPRVHRKMCREVADRILMELKSARLKEEAPGLFHYRVRSFQDTAHYRHMRASMNATIRYSEVDVDDLEMTKRQKINCGAKLLELLEQSIGLIQTRTVSNEDGPYRQEIILEFDPETRQWLDKRNGLLREAWPIYAPMVVPPLAWKSGERGGYRFALRGAERLVRAGPQAQDQGDIQEVYDALNAIQETPWCVNLRVLDVVEEVVDRGGERAGIPRLEEVPMPPKPHDIDTNEEAKRAWKEQARRRHLREKERQSNAAVFLRTLRMANELSDEEELYWPHSLDWRGRVYSIVETLQPQGPDLHRGLLMFAEGRKLGRDGAMWLAVHGANCVGDGAGFKLDKSPLQERVDWVVENSGRLRKVALDPMAHTWWQEADDPWQLLAFCFEWERFIQHRQKGRPDEEFVSFLPVHQDGSCNGLQHLSALLRDEEGAKAVNLVPQEEPQDFYTSVLRATLKNLEKMVETGNEVESVLASRWIASGLVDRSMVKRPAMTFAYGSKIYGFGQQVQEHVRSETDDWWETRDYFTLEIDGEEKDWTYKACYVLARAVWDGIGHSADGAFRAMSWMQEAARAVAKSGEDVSWIVPATGFKVKQNYRKRHLRQVKTVMSGSVLQPSYSEDTDEIDTRKQASAAPPNIVHSLDAANLVLTVNHAHEEGVESFAVVHDSFATHAGSMTLLSRAIRQGFVELHQRPILEDLEAQFITQTDSEHDVPDLPERGNLDVGQVLASRYFFS